MSSGNSGPQLIDTSLWIEALRRDGPLAARRAVTDAVEGGTAIINGLVKAELLRGARDERDYDRLKTMLEAVVCVPLTPATLEEVGRLGFDLRRSGGIVPMVDLVIAASAITQEAELLHCGRYFEIIATGSALRQRQVHAD